jgi:hypothetical protein
MRDLCSLIWCAVVGFLRPRVLLQAEILILRHQLNVLRRKSPKRVALGNIDRVVLMGLYRLTPKVLEALKIINPETVIRWHRTGFRAYWRWKSRPHGGRPKTPANIRKLIREMSLANPFWGAPRIPWRVAQTWDRSRPDDRGKIHGKEKATTVTGLEDVSLQSYRGHRID